MTGRVPDEGGDLTGPVTGPRPASDREIAHWRRLGLVPHDCAEEMPEGLIGALAQEMRSRRPWQEVALIVGARGYRLPGSVMAAARQWLRSESDSAASTSTPGMVLS